MKKPRRSSSKQAKTKLAGIWTKSRLKYRGLKLWQKILAWFGAVIVIIAFLFGLSALIDTLLPPINNPQYGVSFSVEYAQELGVNWQNNLLALMDQLHIKRYRFMSYWETVEPKPGVYDFSQLDWQMAQADKHGDSVSLSIGLRQPRWPECHQPAWAQDLYNSDNSQWQADLFQYITATVEHYKGNPALQSWQLENEALNTWFGDCTDHDRSRIVQEFDLIKKLDPNHPVYMSLSDETGMPVGQPVPDKYGFSEYRIVWNDKTPIHFYITYPTPAWYHILRAWIIELVHHRGSFVHELQMEPWGPKATEYMTVKQQDQSMSPQQMEKNLLFARKTRLNPLYMWGGEWWYYRLTVMHDPGPWNVIKSEIQKYPN